MATYASLTAEEKARLEEHARQLRPLMGELARVLNHCEACDTSYNQDAATIIATLDTGEEIPNPNNIADAAPLTKAETLTLQSYVQGLIHDTTGLNTDAHRTNYARAAGAANLIG